LAGAIICSLVKEGKDAVTSGKPNEDGVSIASEVLARHDGNKMTLEESALARRALSPG